MDLSQNLLTTLLAKFNIKRFNQHATHKPEIEKDDGFLNIHGCMSLKEGNRWIVSEISPKLN